MKIRALVLSILVTVFALPLAAQQAAGKWNASIDTPQGPFAFVFEFIVDAAGTEEPAALIERLPRELRDRVVRRLIDGDQEDRERALADCIGKIRARQSGRSRGVVLEALRAAEARGDLAAARIAQEELNRFLSEKNRT